jgi:pyruvate,water dikinase
MNSVVSTRRYIRWFQEIGIEDVPLVGGKNASLGELYRELTPTGIKVPNGFAITADAYWDLLRRTQLDERIKEILAGLDTQDSANLRQRGNAIRREIAGASFPDGLQTEILAAYHELREGAAEPVDVAVRSSATAEDLPDASFAGQQETYLNVQGDAALLESCKRCFASLFTDRAISYRQDKGFDQLKVGLSIGIQRMVRSDLAASGVMFSIDTESGFPDVVLINAAYGLGENIVQGSVNPDEYYVFKPTLKRGFRPILQKIAGSKEFKLIYDIGGGKMVKNVPVAAEDRSRFAISDEDILTLARWACSIEEHYSRKRNGYSPMDIEWAKDGRSGELFIVQARPETVQSRRRFDTLEIYRLKDKGRALIQGRSVGEKIAQGPVRVVRSAQNLHEVRDGDVLVTEKTDPDWEPMMKKAAAIVTDRGGRTCHAAIVSRELGLPAIVGTATATEVLKDGQAVTVSCAEGEIGSVYEGSLRFDIEHLNLHELPRPRTKVMMNVGNPQEAFHLSFMPNDGIGLAREEFIITTYIKIHPLALIDFEHLEDRAARAEIERLTAGYADKSQYFIDKLAQGVAMIGAAFYPKDVVVR